MTQPHLPSDDLAINAAQARIRENREASLRSWLERVLDDPSGDHINGLISAAWSLHHHREHLRDKGRTSPPDIARAQSDFGRNPTPLMVERGERLVPRHSNRG